MIVVSQVRLHDMTDMASTIEEGQQHTVANVERIHVPASTAVRVLFLTVDCRCDGVADVPSHALALVKEGTNSRSVSRLRRGKRSEVCQIRRGKYCRVRNIAILDGSTELRWGDQRP
ncbi:hypothetical protein L915_16124 [Phytophthora nicotianae]|uniref:Uncharacterized protein n=2 Tax=Phytophthora nicotianae TaxID=4792 RepID=V9DVL5_PHYNI|nr:hypothetical protein F443_22823 [Phytophthora nicotianae P1569]ETK77629.1 hypothetical protein L915_16124 [Phytophthora nicotianae]ETM30611.1 hypothetical protein L914_21713 [Phytophthora nicotianae]